MLLRKFPNLFPARQDHQQGCLVLAQGLVGWWSPPPSTRSGAGWVAPARPVLELRHQNCPGQFLQQARRPKRPQSTPPRKTPPSSPCHCPSHSPPSQTPASGAGGWRCLLVRDPCATGGSGARALVGRVEGLWGCGAEQGNRSGRRLAANPPVRKQEFHRDDDEDGGGDGVIDDDDVGDVKSGG